ncbi:DUF5808 domain-containing protein [Kineococcus rhizosphaerae]|uniref:Putative membrane protein n=1 Tax=Kineococcus rhizosphaerae TaxID=559628 RepID=A0A2T0R599_9ACTN|nr:DUF5808 domain-containing protein [Kineococcus rhizosphaerae]PRY15943.1 putative membrane protein [Kineococcus rhizosphaerae]
MNTALNTGLNTAVGVGSVLLVALTLLLVPTLSAPTLPLGVSVPRERVTEPVVRRAVRTYRVAVAVLAVLAVLAAVAGRFLVLPTYLLLVTGTVAFVVCRRPIRSAKETRGWFRDVPVRLVAGVGGVSRPPVPVFWYAASAGVLVATAAFGWTRYDELPDPFPTHWGGAGVPDAYSAKGFWSVFGPLVAGAAVLLFLLVLTRLVRVAPLRPRAGDADPLALPLARERAAQSLLGSVTLLATALICALAADGWLHPRRLEFFGPALGVFGAGTVVAVVVCAVRSRVPATPSPAGGAQAPDDDRFWRAGLFYVNRDDPALLVPKRVGVGWTLNFGHRVGAVIGVGLLVLVAVGLVLPLVLSGVS